MFFMNNVLLVGINAEPGTLYILSHLSHKEFQDIQDVGSHSLCITADACTSSRSG